MVVAADLPSHSAVSTMIISLSHIAATSKSTLNREVVLQAASMLMKFDRHRGMYERRRHTLKATLARVLKEYREAEVQRESEYEVMIGAALVLNAIERDEPIGWIPGQLRPARHEGLSFALVPPGVPMAVI